MDLRQYQHATQLPGSRGRRSLSVAVALLLALVFIVLARAGEKPGTIPPPELVGQWQGQGRVAVPWTTVQSMPVNLTIRQDGTVTGQVGIANVAGGGFAEYSKKKKSPYVLTVNLEGALLEDGIIRRSFRLNLRPEGARLTGSGASDGVKTYPRGAIREYVRRFGRVEVISISLSKRAAHVVPSN